ncbi:MAG: hypothetical protein V4850_20690 [Myxococcota bacterium]
MVRYMLGGLALVLLAGFVYEVSRTIGFYPWGILIAVAMVLVDASGLFFSRPRPS